MVSITDAIDMSLSKLREIVKNREAWIFIRRPNAEVRIIWPPGVKGQLFDKDPDVGND